MTRLSIKSALTRLVVIVSIATSIGVGSVGVVGTAEVEAMPRNCRHFLAMAWMWTDLSFLYGRLGWTEEESYATVMVDSYMYDYEHCS